MPHRTANRHDYLLRKGKSNSFSDRFCVYAMVGIERCRIQYTRWLMRLSRHVETAARTDDHTIRAEFNRRIYANVTAPRSLITEACSGWPRTCRKFAASLASQTPSAKRLRTTSSLAIHYMHYNFVRIHQSLRVTHSCDGGWSGKIPMDN
jgi:hypothetical protein